MKITLLCKTCHETEFRLLSEQGLVKFQCTHCDEVQNQLKIGKNEIYKNRCTSCHSDVFKVRIDREKQSAHIECKKCKEAPEKILIEEQIQKVTREEIIREEVALTKIEEEREVEKKKDKALESNSETKEILSLLWEMRNDVIRLSNRVEELERKNRVENAKSAEEKNESMDLESLLKKFMSRK